MACQKIRYRDEIAAKLALARIRAKDKSGRPAMDDGHTDVRSARVGT